ncbi:MAG: ribbon-helix-helix domain-containing protein [bacterium]|nr:ribbon-helix-helix domain-containing protein [bacterium]
MRTTITVRLPDDLAEWLSETARNTGLPVSRIVRDQLERARNQHDNRPYLRHAGAVSGPPDLSSRKGFSTR